MTAAVLHDIVYSIICSDYYIIKYMINHCAFSLCYIIGLLVVVRNYRYFYCCLCCYHDDDLL